MLAEMVDRAMLIAGTPGSKNSALDYNLSLWLEPL
jgi:hypothetical protein